VKQDVFRLHDLIDDDRSPAIGKGKLPGMRAGRPGWSLVNLSAPRRQLRDESLESILSQMWDHGSFHGGSAKYLGCHLSSEDLAASVGPAGHPRPVCGRQPEIITPPCYELRVSKKKAGSRDV
jgi:hypothetical protein